jgi:hypothetical protein
MKVISIITRKLKDGKTYEDFRQAWFHTIGFGTSSKLYTSINAFDQREIIVVGFVEILPGQDPMTVLRIDVKERLDNPLDHIIEPEIGRIYSILVSEDDFSATGTIKYQPPSINGKVTDLNDISKGLLLAKQLITQASAERDTEKKKINTQAKSKND